MPIGALATRVARRALCDGALLLMCVAQTTCSQVAGKALCQWLDRELEGASGVRVHVLVGARKQMLGQCPCRRMLSRSWVTNDGSPVCRRVAAVGGLGELWLCHEGQARVLDSVATTCSCRCHLRHECHGWTRRAQGACAMYLRVSVACG
jgi:hypothetical protein